MYHKNISGKDQVQKYIFKHFFIEAHASHTTK